MFSDLSLHLTVHSTNAMRAAQSSPVAYRGLRLNHKAQDKQNVFLQTHECGVSF